MRLRRVAISAGLLLIAAAPPLAERWEAGLVSHVLLQIPLLVVAGVLLGTSLTQAVPSTRPSRQVEGIAAVLLAMFCLAFWMLPRWLDAAVVNPYTDMVKITTVVLLAGLPLGWGWTKLGNLARAFIWANLVSMFAAVAVLYLSFPDRLCNNYLYDEQLIMGRSLLVLAICFGLIGAARALFGNPLAPKCH